jgi:hypothetical protein
MGDRLGLLMMIATSSKKILTAPRIPGWAPSRLCVSSPLRRTLIRGHKTDPVYYLGTRLRQQLITPGVHQFVARTRTLADPFDVLYHTNPCC